MNNNNLSPLAFYRNIDEQAHKMPYAYGEIFPLLYPVGMLPPFQIIVNQATTGINRVVLCDENGNELQNIGVAGIYRKTVEKYAIIYSLMRNVKIEREGRFMLKIETRAGTINTLYYSDIFVWSNTRGCIQLIWANHDNIEYENGQIVYENGYKNILFFDTEIGKPEYEFEEEGEKRDGLFFAEKQISIKKYNMVFLANEPLCDCLRTVRLSDYVGIVDQYGRTYRCTNFLINVKWQTQGNIASIEAEFETDTIIKNIGKGYGEDQQINIFEFDISKTELSIGNDTPGTIDVLTIMPWEIKPLGENYKLTLQPRFGVGNITVDVTTPNLSNRVAFVENYRFQVQNNNAIYKDCAITKTSAGYLPEIGEVMDKINAESMGGTFDVTKSNTPYELMTNADILECFFANIDTLESHPHLEVSINGGEYVEVTGWQVVGGDIRAYYTVPGDPGATDLYSVRFKVTLEENLHKTLQSGLVVGWGRKENGIFTGQIATEIVQKGIYIELDKYAMSIANGAKETVNVSSDNSWAIRLPENPKLTLSPVSGIGNGTVDVTAHTLNNRLPFTEDYRFYIESNPDIFKDLAITQESAGILPELVEVMDTINAEATGGTFDISKNGTIFDLQTNVKDFTVMFSYGNINNAPTVLTSINGGDFVSIGSSWEEVGGDIQQTYSVPNDPGAMGLFSIRFKIDIPKNNDRVWEGGILIQWKKDEIGIPIGAMAASINQKGDYIDLNKTAVTITETQTQNVYVSTDSEWETIQIGGNPDVILEPATGMGNTSVTVKTRKAINNRIDFIGAFKFYIKNNESKYKELQVTKTGLGLLPQDEYYLLDKMEVPKKGGVFDAKKDGNVFALQTNADTLVMFFANIGLSERPQVFVSINDSTYLEVQTGWQVVGSDIRAYYTVPGDPGATGMYSARFRLVFPNNESSELSTGFVVQWGIDTAAGQMLFEVVQNGSSLTVTPSQLTIGDNETKTVKIECASDWSTSPYDENDLITTNPISGSGNFNINVHCPVLRNRLDYIHSLKYYIESYPNVFANLHITKNAIGVWPSGESINVDSIDNVPASGGTYDITVYGNVVKKMSNSSEVEVQFMHVPDPSNPPLMFVSVNDGEYEPFDINYNTAYLIPNDPGAKNAYSVKFKIQIKKNTEMNGNILGFVRYGNDCRINFIFFQLASK